MGVESELWPEKRRGVCYNYNKPPARAGVRVPSYSYCMIIIMMEIIIIISMMESKCRIQYANKEALGMYAYVCTTWAMVMLRASCSEHRTKKGCTVSTGKGQLSPY